MYSYSYNTRRSSPFKKIGYTLLALLVLCLILAGVQIFRPIPAPKFQVTGNTLTSPGSLQLQWPTNGQAIVAVDGEGVVGQFGNQTPVPIASLTKMMTALLVLERHPLAPGQQGPVLTLTQQDVQIYNHDLATGQSVMKVQAGEQLSERQLLEGLLLPSGNNIASVLANWTSGNSAAFVQAMNQKAKSLGMTHTTYTTVSGADSTTVSTAADQLKVVEADMKIRAFRHIVDMPQATLPVSGTVYNVDYALGKDGIVGIKTGNLTKACFAFAANDKVQGHTYLVVGDVLNQGGYQPLMTALTASEKLIQSADAALKVVTVIPKGQTLGEIVTPWGSKTTVVAKQSVSMLTWPGRKVAVEFKANTLAQSISAGTTVGTAVISSGDQQVKVPVQTTGGITAPSYKWRLERL
ncbi:D-alanyl-D-alanine carboxypeptidase [Alicyclobacillus tolerans]|uniref:D-alanyl-D-alanine carboxypeptidase family protein n=1 Tax=Alicyclobacillus tolerans TaxID=90970 RepID=UPI001F2F6B8F|nr:D-alanyl-D-alanine carboxypeptidase [Alicyclobacillus tolerans]MCF8564350.1 D-alanyl-D-alanine carboxypeptidase [Alicyclobacillus tolerans]